MMASNADCGFPALLEKHDPGVLRLLLLASQSVTEKMGGTFDPGKFGVCEYEGQAPTLARLNERSLTVCRKHADTIQRVSTADKASQPVGKPQQVSGGYSITELAGEFPDLRSWSQTPDQRGERALTWRTTDLSAGDINSFGGSQAAREGMTVQPVIFHICMGIMDLKMSESLAFICLA